MASDTITPTSTSGENRLRCVGRVLNGLRRCLRIIIYLFLLLKIVHAMRGMKYAIFGIAMLCSPQLWKLIVSLLLNRVRYTPKQVFVLFASPVKHFDIF